MARTKRLEHKLDEVRWLSKQEAITYIDICDDEFKTDWRPYLNQYDNGSKGARFDKRQIDNFMEHRKIITGKPFEEWVPKSLREQL